MNNMNPWDEFFTHDVVRGNHLYPPAQLEPGVKFFVLELEKRGCRTVWSCEGHPYNFHVIFRGPIVVARAIVQICNLDVEIAPPIVANGHNGYTLSLRSWEVRPLQQEGWEPWSDEQRIQHLRKAANAWIELLDEQIRQLRDDAAPAARAVRRALPLCDECTDPSGCRSLGWCAVEFADEMIKENEPDASNITVVDPASAEALALTKEKAEPHPNCRRLNPAARPRHIR